MVLLAGVGAQALKFSLILCCVFTSETVFVISLVRQMSEFLCHLHGEFCCEFLCKHQYVQLHLLENPRPTMETELESNRIRSTCIVQHM